MPRVERKGRINKKRGKKGGKKEENAENTQVEAVSISTPMEGVAPSSTPNTHEGPAGIVFNDQHFQAAHFGEVDEELLGYFKNVEQTLDDPHFETGEGKI
jgi:nucleolar protein 9